MKEYAFEVKLVAVVRVNAQNESLAGEVVLSSALGSPSPDEIRLANEIHGGDATITAVEFFSEKESVRLIRDNGDNDWTWCWERNCATRFLGVVHLVIDGTFVIGVGEVLKITIVERLFQVGRDKLMMVPAFARCYEFLIKSRQW
jgi:hypothetical protein